MTSPAPTTERPPDIGTLIVETNLPAHCSMCSTLSAMLIRMGTEGATVQCMACDGWWFRAGTPADILREDAGAWSKA